MTESIVIADLHTHLYPCYDTGKALHGALDNFRRAAPKADVRILALAERSDCRFFRDIKQGATIDGFERIEIPDDPSAVGMKSRQGETVFIVAGRQIVSRERIEVVALTTDNAPADGMPIRDLLVSIRNAGAVACINWAPGKWMGTRGTIIETLIREGQPGDFVLSDTTLRPTVWSEPRLMKEARKRGFTIIAGSDPLPFPGEETVAGQYASMWTDAFDPLRPTESLRLLLTKPPLLVGHRDNVVRFLCRWWRNQRGRAA